VPVIVDTDHVSSGFDLIANNEHLHESEVSQLSGAGKRLPPDLASSTTCTLKHFTVS